MLNALSKHDYLATMDEPMHFIDVEDEDCPVVQIGDYFRNCIRSENIATDVESAEIHAVYAAPGNEYCHVLLNWGVNNLFLVIVTQPNKHRVYGHYLLDVNEEYGFYDTHDAN